MNVELTIASGRFLAKTLASEVDKLEAFSLRYRVFQREMIGSAKLDGIDRDEFDKFSDHLAIYDQKNGILVATCRLNCSLFSNQFYTESEFNCKALLERTDVKLEIGRVCVHEHYRKGIIVLLLWRALAEYMRLTRTKILFGCGSVMTEDPAHAWILYRYLLAQDKVKSRFDISPKEKFQSQVFNRLLKERNEDLTDLQIVEAERLLPPLCRSYFDIGCYTPGVPAFDADFKCIDFLTILEVADLDDKVRRKMGLSKGSHDI